MNEILIFRNSNLWLKSYSENSELLRTELESRVRFLSFVKRNLSCSLRHKFLRLIKLEKTYKRNRVNYSVTHCRRNVMTSDCKVFLTISPHRFCENISSACQICAMFGSASLYKQLFEGRK
jgi:hypothetical protein